MCVLLCSMIVSQPMLTKITFTVWSTRATLNGFLFLNSFWFKNIFCSIDRSNNVRLSTYFQINFLLSQVLALFLASFFRSFLHPTKVPSGIRHIYGLSIGLCLGYFCFGQQAIHIAGLPALCYIVIRTQNPQIVQRYE